MAHAEAELAAVVRDPVCGMTLDPDAGKPSREHAGRTFHFCSQRCGKRFAAAPEEFLVAKELVCDMTVDRASANHTAMRGRERF